MKLRRTRISRFKGLKDVDLNLVGADGRPVEKILILGDNGSGKTTLLQAIGLVLGMATRRVRSPEEFPWYGFIAERMGSLGQTRIELEVEFDDDEIRVTQELCDTCRRLLPAEETVKWVNPGSYKTVTLVYDRGEVTSPQGAAARMQFLGRYYLRRVLGVRPELRDKFAQVGDVFWFDQFRNLGVAASHEAGATRDGWTAGVEQLRGYLVGWWSHHLSKQRNGRSTVRDYIVPLEQKMATVFPGFRFVGTEPREGVENPRPTDYFVLVEREGCPVPYDIAEMSSGEQGVFPLAYEITRLEIARSVVLLDELELHLHPPEQQALWTSLTELAPDCQFIVTSHSKYLDDIVPEELKFRLRGGRLCL